MKFSFTEDQRLFASGLRDLLANECTPTHVREAWENHTGHIPQLWSRLTDMGVLSMLVPESAGGMGGTLLDAILLFQELGRAGVPGPVLEHMAVAAQHSPIRLGDLHLLMVRRSQHCGLTTVRMLLMPKSPILFCEMTL